MKTYRNVGPYALTVSSGVSVAPMEDVELPDSPDSHDRAHLEAGRLVELEAKPRTRIRTNEEGSDQ